MTDLALIWNAADSRADLALVGGALLLDEGLRTAVLISLMTDATARDDDNLADGDAQGQGDRRGWWGDLPVEGQPARGIGSRLWLLRRAKATEGTRLRAITMVREALAWMVADGICQSIGVEAVLGGNPPDRLLITVTLRRGGTSARFDIPWSFEGIA